MWNSGKSGTNLDHGLIWNWGTTGTEAGKGETANFGKKKSVSEPRRRSYERERVEA
jgi:hypothetical protein